MSEEHKIIEGDAIYHVWAVVCPHCGEDALVPLGLQSRLERTRDEAKICLKATVVAETGEIVTLDAGDR